MAKKSIFGKIFDNVAKTVVKQAFSASKPVKSKTVKKAVKPTSNIPTPGSVKVSVVELDKYLYSGVMDKGTFNKTQIAILNGETYIYLPESRIQKLQVDYENELDRREDWGKLCDMKYDAQSTEKVGDLEAAVDLYKDLVLFASKSKHLKLSNYSYDINRLRIVSNKLKRKEDFEEFIKVNKIKYIYQPKKKKE